ncbi:amidohydrolase family-domain-containing protein [Durotheca rogersii]|uniref:amidohydrolase family-domain-containing protein n=1 Tax=Durotheca rogersii TaxID=419775 RepID=UPI00221F7BC4|nr:amidohydrolase family-domain-containing protein [Durotheca rogersii]KAI5861183.1 amidohydrolase family-domain-containing protein [Durotheca rogersii]
MDRLRIPRLRRDTAWLYAAALVAVLAGVVKLRQGLLDYAHTETHCYQSVHTNWAEEPNATCFSVSPSGTFTRVFRAGADTELARSASPGFAMPGLWDGHGHLLQYGEFLNSVDLFGSASMDDVRARVRTYASRNPSAGSSDEWLRGVGWDQMALGKMPTASDLAQDEELKGLYIMLDRVDVHCVWVSQAVLDLLPDPIPDVTGGEIVREPGMGVFCDNAMDVVMALWPKPDASKKRHFLKSAMKELNGVGLVGVHDAGVTPGNLNLYKKWAGGEDWTVRVYAMIECYERNTFCPDEVEQYQSADGFLSIRSVKLFADGALGSWGSALIDPYTDRPDTSGSLLVNASELTFNAIAWSGRGFQVNIHAIGDLANRHAIDAIVAALRLLCPGEPLARCQARHRFRVEHAQIIHPDDQARLLAVGIIPSVQPTHATSDMAYAEARLGGWRTGAEAYRLRSLLPARPVLGSDFPVEPPDPFEGMYAAVARRSPHTGRGRGAGGGWLAEEALALDDAVRGFTEAPARAAFLEGRAGAIAPGAYADWVVLDAPLDGDFDPEALRTLRVRETWVAGKRVYAREGRGRMEEREE